MAKTLNDTVLDGALDVLATADRLFICSSQPTTYTEASVTYALADVTVTPGDGNGDFTIADGDSGGRKLTVAQQAAITVDASGTANYLAFGLTTGSVLLGVTTITAQSISVGNTVTLLTFKCTLGDPT